MDKTDRLIGRALTENDRALLERDTEQNYAQQAVGLFRGPLGWVAGVAYATGVAAFVACLFAAWQLLQVTDPLAAVRWATLSIVMFQFTMMSKGFMASRMESNRTVRELKRLELQVALLREGDPAANAMAAPRSA